MALINCPECERPKISSTAISCPDCGYDFAGIARKAIADSIANEQAIIIEEINCMKNNICVYCKNKKPPISTTGECKTCGKGNVYVCNKCGGKVGKIMNKCKNCGKKLSSCLHCNGEMNAVLSFCKSCGRARAY